MESSQEVAATDFADAAMHEVLHATPAAQPTREQKIDEVMDFLRYSVKNDTTFEGTILFKFKADEANGIKQSTYLVSISDAKEVTAKKNGSPQDAKVTCEVAISMDDFLYLYSGQASNSDVIKLFYAGRVSISGYAFRKVSNFAQSFDFSSEMWRSYYVWRDQNEQSSIRRSPGAHNDVAGSNAHAGSPSRDFWFYYCRAILERYNISKLQRITWEASLASMFGDQFILDNLSRSVQSRRSFSLPQSRHKQQVGLVSALVGIHAPASRMQSELTHCLYPQLKRRNSIATVLSVNKHDNAADVFGFFDEHYVDAVKDSAKQRLHRAQHKNRVDLADAGMEQLDKLLKAFGKDGHSNKQRKTKPKYIPAPELFLREFQTQATELVHVIQEKALGRKRVDRIPPPDTAWLLGGGSGVLVVSGNELSHSHDVAATSTAAAAQALVIVDRSQVQRRGSKRDFEVPKQKIIAKIASLSRDLAKHNSAHRPLSFDDHMIFSDYT